MHKNGETAFHDLVMFLSEHEQSLKKASINLGGPQRKIRTTKLLDELFETENVTSHASRELGLLVDLLTLKHVGNPRREESGFFAAIHPSAAMVGEICWLADRLTELTSKAGLENRLRQTERVAA